MALTPANIQMGARRMIWDPAGANVDLGLTLENTSVLRVEQGGEEILAEQTGISPVDFVYAGHKMTFRGVFREWGSLSTSDVLEVLLPGTLQSTGPTVREWQIGNVAGTSARTIAKPLTLRREVDVASANADWDAHMYLACPLMMAEVGLDNQGRSGVWACSFLALVDFTQQVGSGNLLGRWKTDRA
jgi:hypothetical protein